MVVLRKAFSLTENGACDFIGFRLSRAEGSMRHARPSVPLMRCQAAVPPVGRSA